MGRQHSQLGIAWYYNVSVVITICYIWKPWLVRHGAHRHFAEGQLDRNASADSDWVFPDVNIDQVGPCRLHYRNCLASGKSKGKSDLSFRGQKQIISIRDTDKIREASTISLA